MPTQAVIADLRRLYHHVYHGGTWQRRTDTNRLSRGIQEIERLSAYLLKLAQDTPHQVVKDEINVVLNGVGND